MRWLRSRLRSCSQTRPGASSCARRGRRGVPCVIGTTGFQPDEKKEIEALASRIPIVLARELLGGSERALPPGARGRPPARRRLRRRDRRAAPRCEDRRAERDRAAHRGGDRGRAGHERGAELRAGARRRDRRARPPARSGCLRCGAATTLASTRPLLGQGERLELAHRSATRDHFARGALRAAAWVLERPPGLYDMEQVLGLRPA